MPSNADLFSRIQFRLFRSHFDFNRSGDFAQGRSGTGWIFRPNGKLWQVNGLGDRDDTCARESSRSGNPVERDEGEFIPAREDLAPDGRPT